MKVQIFLAAIILFLCAALHANEAQVVEDVVQKAKQNAYWKVAFITGENEQVVFMSVSPDTNPKNEIGSEWHPFDQVILIVEGKGKVVIADKGSLVEEGDMIFIPQGTTHNVINLNPDKPLKLISFYSNTDIPKGSVYKTQAQEHEK